MYASLADPRETVDALNARYGCLPAQDLIAAVARNVFAGRVAALSSFGADSAVLLHLISKAAPDLPVLFLQTGKHFTDTLVHRAELAERLGLTNVIDLKPAEADLREQDPMGRLHESDPEACCHIRKVRPLANALDGYEASISGRRRHQAETRARLKVFERDGQRIKVNPLAGWSEDDVAAYIDRHGLPHHPLVAEGYPSIGCAPCTSPVADGEDARAGRWRGLAKTECGIHTVAAR